MREQIGNNTPSGGRHTDLSQYATRPTGVTLFLRTFLPWQFIRFLVINAKILLMTIRNEKLH